jgi:hypothetical protein
MIFAVSTYLIGFLELVSVKRDLNSLSNESAVYFEAIIMNLISIFLIAILSFIVIDKSKKISTTPWIALLTCSLFIELSNKASDINQIKDLYSFSAAVFGPAVHRERKVGAQSQPCAPKPLQQLEENEIKVQQHCS